MIEINIMKKQDLGHKNRPLNSYKDNLIKLNHHMQQVLLMNRKKCFQLLYYCYNYIIQKFDRTNLLYIIVHKANMIFLKNSLFYSSDITYVLKTHCFIAETFIVTWQINDIINRNALV